MTPGKIVEVQGRSRTSVEDAIKSAIHQLDKTLQNVRSLWLKKRSVREAVGVPNEHLVDIWITFVGEDWQTTEAPEKARRAG